MAKVKKYGDNGPTFGSGQKVGTSGIYRVVHTQPVVHGDHDVTCVKGEPFPPCAKCGRVTFRLRYAAKHLSEHNRFKKKE